MTAVKDEVAVKLTFDNRQFEQGVKQSTESLARLKEAVDLKHQVGSLKEFKKAAGSLGISFSGLGKDVKTLQDFGHTIDTLTKKTGLLGKALDGVGVWLKKNIVDDAYKKIKTIVTGIPNQIISGGQARAKNIEQAKFQLKGLLGEEEFTKQWELINKNINDAVAGTAYGYDAAAKVASQLRASNIEFGADMEHALRGVSGVAAMTNSSYEEIGHIFTTIAGQGKLMGDQLNQFANRGLNVAAELAKQLNTTESELRKMVTAGKIDFMTFANAMNDAFGEHATKANETFTGALSNVKASLSRMGAQFATPGFEELRKVLVMLIPVLKDIEKLIKPISAGFEELAKTVSTFAINTLRGIHFDFLDMLGAKGTGFSSQVAEVQNVLDELRKSADETLKVEGETTDAVSDKTIENQKTSVDLYQQAIDARKKIEESSKKRIEAGEDEALVLRETEIALLDVAAILNDYEGSTKSAVKGNKNLTDAQKKNTEALKKSGAVSTSARDKALELYNTEMKEAALIKNNTDARKTYSEVINESMSTMAEKSSKAAASLFGLEGNQFADSVISVTKAIEDVGNAADDALTLDTTKKADQVKALTTQVVKTKKVYEAFEKAMDDINKKAEAEIKAGKDEVQVNKDKEAAIKALKDQLAAFDKQSGFSFNLQDKSNKGREITNKLYENAKKAVGGVSDKVLKLFGIEKQEGEQITANAKEYKGLEELAWDVIRGKYGNGEERKQKLEQLGYAYSIVQNKVNELMGCEKRHEVTAEDEAKMAKALGEAYGEAGEVIKKEKTTFEKLLDVLAGIGAAINIVREAGTAVMNNIVRPFLSWAIPIVLDFILSKLSWIGERLVWLNEKLHDSDFFNVKTKEIAQGFKDFGKSVADFMNKAKNLEGVKKLTEAFEKFKTTIAEIGGKIWGKLTEGFQKVGEETDSIFTMENMLNVLDFIANKVADFFNFISEHQDDIVNVLSKVYDFLILVKDAVFGFTRDPIGSIKSFGKFLQNTFSNAKGTILKFFNDLKADPKATFSGLINNAIQGLLKFKGIVDNFFKNIFGNGKELTANAVNKAFDIGEFATSLYERGKNMVLHFIQGITDFFGSEGTGGKVIATVKGFVRMLLSNFDPKKVGAIGGASLFAVLVAKIAKFVGSLRKTIMSVKELPGHIAKVLGSIGDVLNGYAMNLKSDALLKVAGAIGILTLAIVALSFVDTGKVLAVGGTLAGLMLAMAAVIAAIGMYNKAKAMVKASGVAEAMKGAASTASESAKGVGEKAQGLADKNPLAPIYQSVNGFLDGMKTALSKALKMRAMGALLVSIAITIGILVLCVKSLLKVDWQKEGIPAAAAVGVMFAVLVGAIAILSKIGAGGLKAGTGFALIGMALTLYMLLGVIKLFAMMAKDNPDELNTGLTYLALCLLGLAGFTRLLKPEGLLKAAAAFILLNIALTLLIIPIIALSLIPTDMMAAGLLRIIEVLGILVIASMAAAKAGKAKGTASLAKLALALTLLVPAFLLLGVAGAIAKNGIIALGVALLIMVGAAWAVEKLGGDAFNNFSDSMLTMAKAILLLGPAMLLLGASFGLLGLMIQKWWPQMLIGFVAFAAGLAIIGAISTKFAVGFAAISFPLVALAGIILGIVLAFALLPEAAENLRNFFSNVTSILGGIASGIADIFGIAFEGSSDYVRALDNYKLSLDQMKFLTDDVKQELTGRFEELKEMDGSEYEIGLQNVIAYINSLDLTKDQIQQLLDTTMASLIADAQEEFTISFNQVRADVKKLHMNETDEANLMGHVEALASTVPGEFQTKLDELQVKIGELIKDPTVAARIYSLAVNAADAQAVYNTAVKELQVFIANSRLTEDAQAKVQEAVDTLSAEQGETSQYTVNLANLKVWVDNNAVNLTEFQKNKLNTMLNSAVKAATNANLTMDTLMIAFAEEGIDLDETAKTNIKTTIEEAGKVALTDEGAAQTMIDNLIIDLGEKYGWSESAKKDLSNLIQNAYSSSRIYRSKIDHLKVYAKELGWTDDQLKAFTSIMETTFNSQQFDPIQLENIWVELKNSNMTPEEITEFYTKIGDVLNAAANKKITIDSLEASLENAGIKGEEAEEIKNEILALSGLTGEEYQAQMKVITDLVMEAAPGTLEGEEAVQQFLTDLGIYGAQSGDYKTAVVESMVLAVKSVDWGEGDDETEAAYIEKIRGLLALDGSEIGEVIDQLIVTMSQDPRIDPAVLATVQSLGEQLHNTFTAAYSTDLDELLKKEERIRRKKFLGSFVTDQETGYTVKNKSSVAEGMKKYFKGETEVTQDLLDQFMDDLDQQLWDEKLSLEDFLASFDNMGMSDEELINLLFFNGDISKGLNPAAFRDLMGPLIDAYITGSSDEFKYRLTRDNPDKIDYTQFIQELFTDGDGKIDWVGMRNYSAQIDKVIEENKDLINNALDKAEDSEVTIPDILRALFVGQGKNGAITADQLELRNIFGDQTLSVFSAFYDLYTAEKERLGDAFREEDFFNTFLGSGTLIAKDATEATEEAFDRYYTLTPLQRDMADKFQEILNPDETNIEPKELYKEIDEVFSDLGLYVKEKTEDGEWVDVKPLSIEDILTAENPAEFINEFLDEDTRNALFEAVPGLREYWNEAMKEGFTVDPSSKKKIKEDTAETAKEAVDGAKEAVDSATEEAGSKSGGGITDLVGQLLSGDGDVAQKAMEAIQNGLSEGGDDYKNQLGEALKNALGLGEGFDVSTFFGEEGLDLSGLGINESTFLSGFEPNQLIEKIIGGISTGGIDLTKLKEVGGFLTGGMAEGITGGLSSIVGGGEGIAGTLLSTVCSALGINSPSTVMKGLGEYADAGFALGLITGKSKVIRQMMEVVKSAVNVVKDRYDRFVSAGEASGTAYATGISNQTGLARIAAEMLSLAAEWAIRLNLSTAEDLGEDWGKGYVKGVESQVNEARAAGRKLGEATEQGYREVTQTRSPSRVAMRLGNYWGLGYITGLEEYIDKAGRVGRELGDKTLDALKTPMMLINDVLNADLDSSPVITPVLDLSNIQNGARAINGMIPSEAMSLGYISYSMRNRNQATNADIVSAIMGMSGKMDNAHGGDTYNINGVTYDDGSNIVEAVQALVRAARVERRR